MNYFEIILLAIVLSIDAMAASMTNGMCAKKIRVYLCLKISFSFAIFQALMPLIGYLASFSLKNFINSIDHIIAFLLLLIIGIKMIVSCLKNSKNTFHTFKLTNKTILVQSIATSIDALTVGISFKSLNVNPALASLIIFIITFINTLIAAFVGKRLIKFFKFKAEIIGGIVLILIGVKILIDGL